MSPLFQNEPGAVGLAGAPGAPGKTGIKVRFPYLNYSISFVCFIPSLDVVDGLPILLLESVSGTISLAKIQGMSAGSVF